MEQDKRAVLGLSEGVKEMRGAVTAGEAAGAEGGLARGAASSSSEDVTAMDNAGGHGAERDEDEDLEDALTEESEGVAAVVNASHGAATGSAKNEGHEVPKSPLVTRSKFRWAIAHPTPPSSWRRLLLRTRKQSNPTPLIAVGAARPAGGDAHVPGALQSAGGPLPPASHGSASATTLFAGGSAMANAGQGAKNEALGSTTEHSVLDATVDRSSSDDDKNTAAAASRRLPSRGRKQRRPDHFIPTEAEATARVRARRSNDVLDRFITSQIHAPPEQRPEWVRRNITADGVRDLWQRGIYGFRTASWGGPEEPDDSARILAVLAILGVSLALSVASCVLFYVVGQETHRGPSDEHQKE